MAAELKKERLVLDFAELGCSIRELHDRVRDGALWLDAASLCLDFN